jgi:vitamin B12 transporter
MLSLCVAPAAAAAQDSVAPPAEPAAVVEEEIVVSASLRELPRVRSGSAVTVITREQLEQREEVSVLELLRQVPGLAVVTTGGAGGQASVFIRGANSSHTLVLVDGVRVNSPAGGAFDWADLTTDDVERIEVLRGAQSALYGSEAIGGVISIVSRRGGAVGRATGGAEAGSHGFWRLRADAGGGSGAWDWRVAASRQESDGVSSASEAAGNREEDPWENLTLAAGVGRSLPGDGSVRVDLRYVDAATALDGFDFVAGPVDDLGYDQDREQLVAAVAVDVPISTRWRQKLRVGRAEERLEASNEDPALSFLESLTETTITSVDLVADVDLSSRDSFSVGASWEQRDGESPLNFSETVDIGSLYAEHRFAWGDGFFLNLGLRHDDHSVYGGETTYRAAASYLLPATATRLHGSWGTGFKAPTFVDLYFPFYGNPDLAPETSRGFDLGVEQPLADDWRLDLTYFQSDFDDLIVFDLATFLAGNVAEAKVKGFELTARWQPVARFSTDASYTHTDSEDLATGRPLGRRPEHRYTLALRWAPIARLDATLSYEGVRRRFEGSGAAMDDYDRVDATLGYRFASGWKAFARARNLFDEEYEEVLGYTTPGIEVAVGFQVSR